ncbi:MAG: DUF4145 domain-containing protein [Roseiflexaceae bacterium]
MRTYQPGERTRRPHFHTVVRFDVPMARLNNTQSRGFDASITIDKERLDLMGSCCPHCKKPILTLQYFEQRSDDQWGTAGDEFLVWPLQSMRLVPPEVPADIASDYNEAALVLSFSPKASAALSRRCLQAVLRAAGYNQHNLSQQIDAVMPHLPSYITGNIDAVRQIGNFAAHPMKSQTTGQILDVEPGEAGWNLKVLDQLFDFFYVQPALARQKRDALNAKLQEANKPPMK